MTVQQQLKMKALASNSKVYYIDNGQNVTIDIIKSAKDETVKFKFKKIMAKIFIASAMMLLITSVYFALKDCNYDFHLESFNTSQGYTEISDILDSNENTIRTKRQTLDGCQDCHNVLEADDDLLESAVKRCKKNIEVHKDCCELWKKVRKLDKAMEDVKKEFHLIDIPCKLNKTEISNSISDESTETKSPANQEFDENSAKEIEEEPQPFPMINNAADGLNVSEAKYQQSSNAKQVEYDPIYNTNQVENLSQYTNSKEAVDYSVYNSHQDISLEGDPEQHINNQPTSKTNEQILPQKDPHQYAYPKEAVDNEIYDNNQEIPIDEYSQHYSNPIYNSNQAELPQHDSKESIDQQIYYTSQEMPSEHSEQYFYSNEQQKEIPQDPVDEKQYTNSNEPDSQPMYNNNKEDPVYQQIYNTSQSLNEQSTNSNVPAFNPMYDTNEEELSQEPDDQQLYNSNQDISPEEHSEQYINPHYNKNHKQVSQEDLQKYTNPNDLVDEQKYDTNIEITPDDTNTSKDVPDENQDETIRKNDEQDQIIPIYQQINNNEQEPQARERYEQNSNQYPVNRPIYYANQDEPKLEHLYNQYQPEIEQYSSDSKNEPYYNNVDGTVFVGERVPYENSTHLSTSTISRGEDFIENEHSNSVEMKENLLNSEQDPIRIQDESPEEDINFDEATVFVGNRVPSEIASHPSTSRDFIKIDDSSSTEIKEQLENGELGYEPIRKQDESPEQRISLFDRKTQIFESEEIEESTTVSKIPDNTQTTISFITSNTSIPSSDSENESNDAAPVNMFEFKVSSSNTTAQNKIQESSNEEITNQETNYPTEQDYSIQRILSTSSTTELNEISTASTTTNSRMQGTFIHSTTEDTSTDATPFTEPITTQPKLRAYDDSIYDNENTLNEKLNLSEKSTEEFEESDETSNSQDEYKPINQIEENSNYPTKNYLENKGSQEMKTKIDLSENDKNIEGFNSNFDEYDDKSDDTEHDLSQLHKERSHLQSREMERMFSSTTETAFRTNLEIESTTGMFSIKSPTTDENMASEIIDSESTEFDAEDQINVRKVMIKSSEESYDSSNSDEKSDLHTSTTTEISTRSTVEQMEIYVTSTANNYAKVTSEEGSRTSTTLIPNSTINAVLPNVTIQSNYTSTLASNVLENKTSTTEQYIFKNGDASDNIIISSTIFIPRTLEKQSTSTSYPSTTKYTDVIHSDNSDDTTQTTERQSNYTLIDNYHDLNSDYDNEISSTNTETNNKNIIITPPSLLFKKESSTISTTTVFEIMHENKYETVDIQRINNANNGEALPADLTDETIFFKNGETPNLQDVQEGPLVGSQLPGQFRALDDNSRIVNQNLFAQQLQNAGSQKFENPFQLPPLESSKASHQLTVNTNMLPMCFYGIPGHNSAGALRQPGSVLFPELQNDGSPYEPSVRSVAGYDVNVNSFGAAPTAYGGFGYPQMYPNNPGQQAMYNYYYSMMAQQKYNPMNYQQSTMTNPYFCTYIPSSSLQFPPIAGISEFRQNVANNISVEEDPDDQIITRESLHLLKEKTPRKSKQCPRGEKSCFDGLTCIKSRHWCDGIIHCKDKSDEFDCPCRSRVDKNRVCDGYFDCPNGEDELGCFGCSELEFSCDDWSERDRTATCVPLRYRCDGKTQCKTRKDEMDCSILTSTISAGQTFSVSKSSGFLYRNFQGNWFPVCSNTDSWVLDACLAEVGPQVMFPLVHMLPVPVNYNGKYLTALPDKKVQFLNACMGNEAIHVICPPVPCGTRLIPSQNPFRKNEVDTSAEEDFLPIVNRIRRFTEEMHKTDDDLHILGANDLYGINYGKTFKDIHLLDDQLWQFVPRQQRGKRGNDRVVGGRPSQPTSWPWVVAIYRDGIFHCGGVLMSELWVITAAHCVDKYWQHYYEIQAGMLRRFSFSPMEQNRVASSIIRHQLYDRSNMKNDLALLKMSKPFQFNRWVRPVCLPSESSAGPNWLWGPLPGTICTAVGWGATVEHGPDPDHMREVEVPILAHCKHRADEEGREICAGLLEGGRDACQGDSGGPLLCRNPLALGQWYVAGIVSHGEGCARPNEPGAYTRISLYLNWIARSILDENLPATKPLQKCPGVLCMGSHRCISKKRRCDKIVDCLSGDDEFNCPQTGFPSLIKHAMDNIMLFSTNNVTLTTVQPGDTLTVAGDTDNYEPEAKNVRDDIETIADETNTRHVNFGVMDNNDSITSTGENDSITSSALPSDGGGQAAAMNRNGGISTTVAEISDITTAITNETANASITDQTFITTPSDTISKSSRPLPTSTHVVAPANNAPPPSLAVTTETPSEINDSRGALNNDDKSMTETAHKTVTTSDKDVKVITETPALSTSTGANGFRSTRNDTTAPSSNSHLTANKTISFTPTSPPFHRFLCKNLPQVISIKRRCNRQLDCEDATDEANCTCRDYLMSSHSEAICDGTLDCKDGTDEKDCLHCDINSFHCHLSERCIENHKKCDHKADCPFGEDEWDCFALTNGYNITIEKDERPHLRQKGIVTVSQSGSWFPLCRNNWRDVDTDVAGDMCIYLGFNEYKTYFVTKVRQSPLQIISAHSTSVAVQTNETCKALYVKCASFMSDVGSTQAVHTAHQTGASTLKDLFMSPWYTAIFIDGVYQCSGTLIDLGWVLTSRKCLDHIFLHVHYVTVVLGIGKGHINVEGPHEQILSVSEIVPIMNYDVTILRLIVPATFTRYVRPLYIKNRKTIVSQKETCIAMGTDVDDTTQAIFLRPILENCKMGQRCFKRVTPLTDCENKEIDKPWGGSIVCLSSSGWYTAAVHYDRKGICGFQTNTEYTSIRYLILNILEAMHGQLFSVNPPKCAGVRCSSGQCIEPNRLCDGISDCPDGNDEMQTSCVEKSNYCSRNASFCECNNTEIKCRNGKCVPKNAFCDRNDDCGDHSDEPRVCNCSAYLALVAPHRLCDGITNCYDKSDENPHICGCKANSFKCGGLCIPHEYVCDGEQDCHNNEDESQCAMLRPLDGDTREGVGELVIRTHGMWHSYCMPPEPLSQAELEGLCEELNYSKVGHASMKNVTWDHPAYIINVDRLSSVKLNRNARIFLRGDHPLATLQKTSDCNRLYLECI